MLFVGFIIRIYHDTRSSECQRRKANWIGHILLSNCLLERVIEEKTEGRIEVMGRRGRRRRKLVDKFRERKGYWKLKRGSISWHSVEDSSWKMLLAARKTYCRRNKVMPSLSGSSSSKKFEAVCVHCVVRTELFWSLRKVAKNDYYNSSYPSVRMEQLGSKWTDFHKI